jgi:hypothetical protein
MSNAAVRGAGVSASEVKSLGLSKVKASNGRVKT